MAILAKSARIASMGPRSFDRGKVMVPGAKGGSPRSLQWGRDLSIAERMRTLPSCTQSESGFNGAAIFRSRKAGTAAATSPARTGFNGAAIFRSRKGHSKLQSAIPTSRFNGAAIFRSRKGGCSRSGRTRSRRFNGAAIFRSRKASLTLGISHATGMLQWGRDLSIAESARAK